MRAPRHVKRRTALFHPDFPWLYHAHQDTYAEDLDFWLACAAGSASPVLELGCGTGRVSLPLAAAGHTVLALDRDPSMLAFLRQRTPPALRPRVLAWQADMACFALATRLDCILLPCNTLSALDDPTFHATLRCIAAHLRPDGRFYASLPNPAALVSLPPEGPPELENTFFHPRSGHPVQVFTAWKRDAHRLHVTWHFDHLQPDGHTERLSVTLHHRLDGVDFYRRALMQAGLRVEALWGDFNRAPYRQGSPYLILAACKAGND